jgi:hypothetical protein
MRFDSVRTMVFQSTTKFLPGSRWVLGSLLFIIDKFGDKNLQEPESPKVAGSGTDCIPLILARDGLIIEAQLGHRSDKSGEAGSDPLGDKTDHNKTSFLARIDPIYQSPLESNFDCSREVYIVGHGEQLARNSAEEITREEEMEIA